MSLQKMKNQTIFIPMIISFLFCFLSCFEGITDNQPNSTPLKSSKKTNLLDNKGESLTISSENSDEQGQGIHQINIHFASDYPSTSADIQKKIPFPVLRDFYDYIDVFVHLTHSVCETDIQKNYLNFTQLLEKKTFDELCIHDRFLLYMSIKEGEELYLQQNQRISEEELQTLIQNMFHPVSFVDSKTNYFDNDTNHISVVYPKKGTSKYQETIRDLHSHTPNQSIIQYCEIFDITCKNILSKQPNRQGSWNINGYIFKGLRTTKQLQRIINFHNKYKASFLQFQNESKK